MVAPSGTSGSRPWRRFEVGGWEVESPTLVSTQPRVQGLLQQDQKATTAGIIQQRIYLMSPKLCQIATYGFETKLILPNCCGSKAGTLLVDFGTMNASICIFSRVQYAYFRPDKHQLQPFLRHQLDIEATCPHFQR